MFTAYACSSDLLVIASRRDVIGGTTVSGTTITGFLADQLMVVPMEVRLYVGERHALSLGHDNVAEHAAGERHDRVHGEVDGHTESVGHHLVSGDHDGGRERDDQQHGRVSLGPRVRREVLALDDAQQRHDADVDEELHAGHGPEQRQPIVVIAVAQHEANGHGHMTGGRAEARDDHQRPPAESVHGERKWYGGRQNDESQNYGARGLRHLRPRQN